ncbi:MAG: hypothetical protein NT154_36320 [Verrucomicrobia bacterium]|nr:hypothetical protein [Verrucomicrobiota bacterium]
MKSSFASQSQVREKRFWGVLLLFALGPLTCAMIAAAAPSQTIILRPATAPGLRIDFNYNFQNALPPFPKEPVLPGKEVARGLIPTVPPTPFLRNVTDSELRLNTDHTRDFVNGKLATYRSFYRGHVVFTNLAVTTLREGLEIPYTLDLFTYERYCAGWLDVRSGWAGEFAVAGQQWRLTVVDNLNGQIGRDDTLRLQRMPPAKTDRMIAITPVPQALFIDGQAFSLGFTFKPGETGAVLQAVLTETNLPLGKLSVAARGCRYVCLSNQWITAVLDAAAGTSSLPAGTYRITDCLLEPTPGLLYQPSFIRCDRPVVITAGQTASLEIGPPLRNTVQVTRERNLLRLTYQLLGQAGEQYEYYNWKSRPRFSVWNGPVKIGSGTLPFG